jgi:transmembrane sensor
VDAELLATLDRAIDKLAFKPPADLDVETALRQVSARIAAEEDRAAGSRSTRRPVLRIAHGRRWSWTPLLAAAAILVVVVGSLVWRGGATDRGARSAVAGPQTFATTVGRRDSLKLSDGTRIVLGPGSGLTVAAGYGGTTRDVELRGDAFFDVVHDARHPFTVHVGDIAVRDVGTAFAVRSRDTDGVRVAVTAGEVIVRSSAATDSGVSLRAGDAGLVRPGSPLVAERGGAAEGDTAWTRGRLIFREAPLTQVGADLRRWYGIELKIADTSLAGRHLTAAFAGEPADSVLSVIGLALGADIERKGDSAIVHVKRTRPLTR